MVSVDAADEALGPRLKVFIDPTPGPPWRNRRMDGLGAAIEWWGGPAQGEPAADYA